MTVKDVIINADYHKYYMSIIKSSYKLRDNFILCSVLSF